MEDRAGTPRFSASKVAHTPPRFARLPSRGDRRRPRALRIGHSDTTGGIFRRTYDRILQRSPIHVTRQPRNSLRGTKSADIHRNRFNGFLKPLREVLNQLLAEGLATVMIPLLGYVLTDNTEVIS